VNGRTGGRGSGEPFFETAFFRVRSARRRLALPKVGMLGEGGDAARRSLALPKVGMLDEGGDAARRRLALPAFAESLTPRR
jgi:hypothetical protein